MKKKSTADLVRAPTNILTSAASVWERQTVASPTRPFHFFFFLLLFQQKTTIVWKYANLDWINEWIFLIFLSHFFPFFNEINLIKIWKKFEKCVNHSK